MRICSALTSSTAPLTRTTGASPSRSTVTVAPPAATARSGSTSGVRRSRRLSVTVVPRASSSRTTRVDELAHDQQPAAAVAGVAVGGPPGALVADDRR